MILTSWQSTSFSTSWFPNNCFIHRHVIIGLLLIVSQPEAMSVWSVPSYLIWAMVDLIADIAVSRTQATLLLVQQKILCCFHSLEAFCCIPQRLLVAVAVGAASTCGWPVTKGGTPWIHEKVKRNDMTKGTRNCETMKRYKTLCKMRQTYQLGQPYDLPIEAEAERKI